MKKIEINYNLLQIGSANILVGSTEWFAWLTQNDRFRYKGKSGHFTAQREIRRNKTFWYAYRRRDRKLCKRYLGKSEELTPHRLEQASLALAGKSFLEALSEPTFDRGAPAEARIDTSLLPKTKVNLPALPMHLVKRPRLSRQLNRPLILITAPSGFGKSTLLNDWSRNCSLPAAWLSLDQGDNHAIRFWQSVILALQTVHPQLGEGPFAYLQSESSIHFPDLVAWLTNEILSFEAEYPHLSLVLDDFHHIHVPEIFEAIQLWLERFPRNMQLILSGQGKPPLSLGQLRARGFVRELGASDLRFTTEEGIQYLQQFQSINHLAYTDLEKLVRHSEGWAAGLTLTALALSNQQDSSLLDTFSGAHIYLREYFIETVLQETSPEIQNFLLKTAVLKNLTGGLCDAVTGQTGSSELLLKLWQEGLFITRLEMQGWYRYHDLFSEMLASLLQARHPDQVEDLHRRAAQWYRQQDAPADAIHHLLEIEAWEEAAALMESMALLELVQYGEDSRLLRWLMNLPESVVQKHKTLLFIYLRLADIALPRQQIERFIASIEDNLSNKASHLQTQDERDVLAEIHRIRREWEHGESISVSLPAGRQLDVRWEVLNGLNLLKHAYDMEPDQFEEQAADLFQKAQSQNNLFVVLMTGGGLARHALAVGRLRRSEKIARQVLEHALIQRGKLPEPASISLAALSQVYLERNELELAQKYLSQAQEVDPNPTSANMPVQIGILRSLIQCAQGQHDEALANIRAVRSAHFRRPSRAWSHQDLLAYQAFIHIRSSDIPAAEQILNDLESSGEHHLSRLARAEIMLEKNTAPAAEEQLRDLLDRYPNRIYFEPLMRARVLLAQALFAQHKVNQALQVITDAVRLAAPEGFYRPFLEGGVCCLPLLLLALKTEKLSPEARNFIQVLLDKTGICEEQQQISQAEIETLSTSASISQREQEVLALLTSGCSNREIAQKLHISESTVKTHLSKIYDKLGVNSRTQAARKAKELKFT
jgi:LuxR family transcriptional regulator, maltose regulon positive regulatory protein